MEFLTIFALIGQILALLIPNGKLTIQAEDSCTQISDSCKQILSFHLRSSV